MTFRQSGRNQAIREAIRKHGRPLACAIERDALVSLLPGNRILVSHSISQLVHRDQLIIYVALNE